MKQIKLLVAGLALFLPGVVVVDARLPAPESFAARHELFNRESGGRKIFQLGSSTKNKIKARRLKARRKAANYSGRWKGTLYQGEGGSRAKFNFSMTLYRKGRNVTGFSRIDVIESPSYYGVMRLRGTVNKNRLSFREIKITQDNPEPETVWCVKSGKLRQFVNKGRAILKGNWQAPNCSPGSIFLRRVSRK
jgi:hypothetical protein